MEVKRAMLFNEFFRRIGHMVDRTSLQAVEIVPFEAQNWNCQERSDYTSSSEIDIALYSLVTQLRWDLHLRNFKVSSFLCFEALLPLVWK